VLCDLFDPLVRDGPLHDEVLDDLVVHAGFLRQHLELDVGGNHLLKDLKALAGLGCFLGDRALTSWATKAIDRQVSIQVLADGGHYERSAAYHVQVLADLVDVQTLLGTTGAVVSPTLSGGVEAMRSWLGAVRRPDGTVPRVNDTFVLDPAFIDALGPQPNDERLTTLAASGYVVARPSPRIHLVADVGDPCPPELPSHAHADTLSFELCVDGVAAIIDVGTSTYDAGARRTFERSTAAHNTVTVDGVDSTEVWGAFRAARLAHGTLARAHDDGTRSIIEASHDGYARLPGNPRHHRTFAVTAAEITITDVVSGSGRHTVRPALHLAPGIAVDVSQTPLVARCGPLEITLSDEAGAPLVVTVEEVEVGLGFQCRATSRVVAAEVDGLLPITLRTTIRLARASPFDE